MILNNSKKFKSMPFNGYDKTRKYNLLSEDFMLPAAVIKERELMLNSKWMQTYSELAGVSLCPHGKTTMIPQLFKIQIDQGAWGITLANSYQVNIAKSHGIKRILLANQLVGKQNILSIFNSLASDEDFDFYCLVDNISNVQELSKLLRSFKNLTLNVLIEVSPSNGRAGVRDYNSALKLAHHIKTLDNINLVGIECFEGIIGGENALNKVKDFLNKVTTIAKKLDHENMFNSKEIILSAGGSAFYDIVCAIFSKISLSKPTRVVIRPGCYLSHDSKLYKSLQDSIKNRDKLASRIPVNLEPAVEVLAYIQSLPEPNLAIINIGKRDVSFDAGLPIPKAIFSRSKNKLIKIQKSSLININDQHAYMKYEDEYKPSVGDIIILGISHPCLTFDKWQQIPLVDEKYNVNQLLETYF